MSETGAVPVLLFVGLAVLGFAVMFVALWCGIALGLSYIGGWGGLASVYRAQRAFEGRRRSFQSGNVGITRYRSALTVGANPEGLHLSVLFFFRVGHPPLFVPWEDVTTTLSKGTYYGDVELRFRNAPSTYVILPQPLVDQLKPDAGGRWPAVA